MLYREITLAEKKSPPCENSRAIFINLMLLNPKMATKMLPHLPLLREKGTNSKTTFLIRKKINIFLKFLCTVQNVKIVSMCNILAKNK
jgi:hypothetical protein